MARGFSLGRREVIRGGAAFVTVAAGIRGAGAAEPADPGVADAKPGGALKQSVSRWCFGKMSLDELAGHAARIGYRGIDLLPPPTGRPCGSTGSSVRSARWAGP